MEVKTGFTPGPWIVEEIISDDGAKMLMICDHLGRSIASIWEGNPYDDNKANANLMGAAPKLLAALKGLLTPLANGEIRIDEFHNAEMAVKEAEGFNG